ncbi:MAG: hypothetical protein J0I01_12210 [Stenotrophomonas nitritireducens]|uniref:Uncharacterized protein n=1 Tax=Stenotrophomonas nitritireducens TaxID=83617 RepID=A0A9D8L1K2_9GAMM|nr:hypothetical protein [Stenotrophomonas nitritireducens]MBN8768945.1 hypothetical protein [Stenotrophomonas sp.]MBN8792983.1 hypothetical protein [Stenotrophomonas nitritireducens]MBN8799807.1 hypothetical protein [Stenotrophomonas nitritireducens]
MPVPPGEDLGELPLILLAEPAPPADAGTPPEVARAREQACEHTRSWLLASSRRRIDLACTSHEVPFDQSQALAAAIEAAKARPPTSAAAPAT